MPPLLTEAEIVQALAGLPGWRREEKTLVRRFAFKTYMDGIRFAEAVAVDAEARDHHPDLLIRYGDVKVFFTTHSAHGITENDVASARSCSEIAPRYEAL